MNFMESFEKTLVGEKQLTENGAIGYRTTGEELLDLNFKISNLRYFSDEQLKKEFANAYYTGAFYAIKWLFYLRDIRGGIGERKAFRTAFNWIAETYPDVARKLINLIPEYGRWDDLFCVIGTEVEDDMLRIILNQLNEDLEGTIIGRPISLLAKWMPSINTSSEETRELASFLANKYKMSHSQYRKMLSKLRKYLDVTEVKMSAKEWNKINYESVPSKANLIYGDAFMRNDEERRIEYLQNLSKGKAKINASTLFPSDIIEKYKDLNRKEVLFEEMWKSLPDVVNNDSNTLVIRDGSGSMKCSYGCGCVPIDVSTALAIYFAERSGGYFHDKFITFSSKPEIVDMSKCESLKSKMNLCYRKADYTNTDIEKTFMLILDAAVKNNMSQEDLPKNLLIVSDMEFDAATTGNPDIALFDSIKERFEEQGYKVPRLIFWNVCSRTNTIPLKENELGVALVSGYSQNAYKMVLSGELDPYKCLLKQLDSERYKLVEEALCG